MTDYNDDGSINFSKKKTQCKALGYSAKLFYADYSGFGASTGQVPAQVPQSIQADASTT